MLTNLHHFFVPHTGNNHRPGFFSAEAVVVTLLIIVTSFSFYLIDVRLLATRDSFIAAILPTVLAYETNQERARNNLNMVEMDNELNLAAQHKASDMAEKSYFAHVSPDGKTPWYWLDLSGYQYAYAGENLAANFEESNDVVRAWIASPSHHENLIKPQYTKMGIGIARGKLNGQETTFVVQLFATPKTNPVVELAKAVTPGGVAEASGAGTAQTEVAQAPHIATPAANIPAKVTPPEKALKTTATAEDSKDLLIKKHDDALLTASLEKERVAEQLKKDEHRKKIVALISAQPATPSLLDEILASPRELLIMLLIAVLTLTMVLFVASTIAGMKVPHRDVVVGTLAISGLTVALLIVVNNSPRHILMPLDTQSASVVRSL